ncbi:MAG TPA: hypothetical protein DD727_02870, partial [Clostridiales bacterium]|nr:hypothetical protein [Clostridiales bacterium]
KPWSPDTPSLYELSIELMQNNKIIDIVTLKTGIRQLRLDPENGLILNGKRTVIKGMCMHHDAGGPSGAAVPDKILEHRLHMLKHMGCNAIRTSHYPFAPEFYELCDRLGFLVMDEFFDGWHKKAEEDYGGRYFLTDWVKDVEDTIRRDRNHICVFMWSIGNETGKEDIHDITRLVHQLDSCGRGEPERAWEPAAIRLTTGGEVHKGVDVQGFNAVCEVPGFMDWHPKASQELPMIFTEAPHVLQTRGFYRSRTEYWNGITRGAYPIPDLQEGDEVFGGDAPEYSPLITYHSSYDNSIYRCNHQTLLKLVEDNPRIIGQFTWTAFDYLGESFGWPFRMMDAGIIDLCGFPKDAYFLYQSHWVDQPVLHILPHWTHPGKEGRIIPVVVYTNCDEVELYVNGISQGRKAREKGVAAMLWNVVYSPGILKAEGVKNSQETSLIYRTAGSAEKLYTEIEFIGDGIWKVNFQAYDNSNNPVPSAGNQIHLDIEGNARLIGMENGDPADLEPSGTGRRNLFHGKCTAFFYTDDYAQCQPDVIIKQDETHIRLCDRGNQRKPEVTIKYFMEDIDPGSRKTDKTLVPISEKASGTWVDTEGMRYLLSKDGEARIYNLEGKEKSRGSWWYDEKTGTGHLNEEWQFWFLHLLDDGRLYTKREGTAKILNRSDF